MGSNSYNLLWPAQTDQNHYRRSQLTKIHTFEVNIEKKMATIRAETWQSDFETWQYEVTWGRMGENLSVFTRHCPIRLSLVPINGTGTGWAAFSFLGRYQKMDWHMASFKRHIVFLKNWFKCLKTNLAFAYQEKIVFMAKTLEFHPRPNIQYSFYLP